MLGLGNVRHSQYSLYANFETRAKDLTYSKLLYNKVFARASGYLRGKAHTGGQLRCPARAARLICAGVSPGPVARAVDVTTNTWHG